MAILDATVDQSSGVISHEVMETDDNGLTPDKDGFKCPSQHSIEIFVKNQNFKVAIAFCAVLLGHLIILSPDNALWPSFENS